MTAEPEPEAALEEKTQDGFEETMQESAVMLVADQVSVVELPAFTFEGEAVMLSEGSRTFTVAEAEELPPPAMQVTEYVVEVVGLTVAVLESAPPVEKWLSPEEEV